MRLKKLSTTIIIVALVIITYARYFGIIRYSNDYQKVSNDTNDYGKINDNIGSYEKISDDTKEKITSIIEKSKGEIPNLQTESCQANWSREAHNRQKEMMDKVLDTLTVLGEAKNGEPNKYIIATFYDEMQVYVPYDEKTPYKEIVIEVNSHYYVATAGEEDINQIVDYMKNQNVLN
jgi:hypothetical protein